MLHAAASTPPSPRVRVTERAAAAGGVPGAPPRTTPITFPARGLAPEPGADWSCRGASRSGIGAKDGFTWSGADKRPLPRRTLNPPELLPNGGGRELGANLRGSAAARWPDELHQVGSPQTPRTRAEGSAQLQGGWAAGPSGIAENGDPRGRLAG